MDFSEALQYVRNGYKIYRNGWNGANQYVVYQRAYPDGIAINMNTSEATGIPLGTVCKFLPYLMIKTVDDCFVPWLASQTDILAYDWAIVKTA